MEQNQEQRKHLCKLCDKSFLSGKVLGGHMRCHMTKKSAKKEKEPINETNIDIKGGERAIYVLRENPKKSWKFSGLNHETSEQGNLCKVCGKGFDSPRALFGHLRHHSGKRKKGVQCKECGKEFESSHMRSHSEKSNISSEKLLVDGQYTSEVSRLVLRRKRSRRSRYNITQSSLSNLSGSSNVNESQKEVEEAATCLLMMSRGIHPESSDNNSATLEIKSLNQNQKIVNNDGENYTCDDDITFMIKKPKFSEHFPGLVCDEKEIGMQDTISNMLCEGVVEKMPELYDESVGEFCNTEIERKRLDWMSSTSIEVEKNEYKCRTCNKIFYSHRSLGGHQTVHRTPKSSWKINNTDTIVCANTFSQVKEANSKLKYIKHSVEEETVSTNYEFKEHKGSICSMVYPSGRALGGHKRAHSVKV